MLLAASTAAQIFRVVWSSLLASVVIACAFSLGVVGLIRASELRHSGRVTVARVCGVAGLLALTICLAAVVYGVVLVTQKG